MARPRVEVPDALYTLVEMALDASPCAGSACGSPECALAQAVLDAWATPDQLAEWLLDREDQGDWESQPV